MNGSEATGNPNPDTSFSLAVAKKGAAAQLAAAYFEIEEPELETWNFTWHEGWSSLKSNF